jgi:hypothetical protein
MRFLQKVMALAQPPIPKAIEQYIMGLAGLPAKTAPGVKKYWNWLQTKLTEPEYKVYRAVTLVDEDDYPSFSRDHLMSFTESKKTALAIAKERSEDGSWACVIEADVPKKAIHFHYALGGELGAAHPKEREILVLMGSGYDEIKRFAPRS